MKTVLIVAITLFFAVSCDEKSAGVNTCGDEVIDQLKHLARAGHTNLHGVDLSPHMLAVARRGGQEVTLHERDAAATGFDDESFDVVILSFALHEKEREEAKAILKEAHRILAPEGTLLVVDYRFDDRTWRLGQAVIVGIERIAGKEHYANCMTYLKSGGLLALLHPKYWDHRTSRRILLGGVTLDHYVKRG